jgi:hypothetical protein
MVVIRDDGLRTDKKHALGPLPDDVMQTEGSDVYFEIKFSKIQSETDPRHLSVSTVTTSLLLSSQLNDLLVYLLDDDDKKIDTYDEDETERQYEASSLLDGATYSSLQLANGTFLSFGDSSCEKLAHNK